LEFGGEFPLHKLIFKSSFGEIFKLFNENLISDEQLNEKDKWGNTPLLLAGKLCTIDQEYLKLVGFMFKYNPNGKSRDINGWSLLDEAVSQ